MNSVGVRLADATPLMLLDGLCLGAFVFLTSRLWVAAAPALGRRLARWTLGILLPLGLVTSVAVHVALPATAEALSDALDFTAFFASIPLGLSWALALAVYWTRRLLKRQRAVREATPSDWLRIALVTLPVAGFVLLVQWDLSRDEVKALDARRGNLSRVLRALEVTALKREEFARDVERIEASLGQARKIVPRGSEIDAFVAELRPVARDRGINLLEWTSAPSPRAGVLEEHLVVLQLSGDVRRVAELATASRKLARLAVWHSARLHGGNASVRVSIYSATDREARPYADACAHPTSAIWLWPYTARVKEARVQVDQVCADVKRLVAVQRQVDRYQTQKGLLEDLLSAIETVRSSRPKLQVIDEDGTGTGPTRDHPAPRVRRQEA